MSIKISTITPCFRMGAYLPEFLARLPQQTCFNELEVIIDHNDPSDEEIKVIQTFQQQYPNRVQHIITRPVQPVGASMNTCWRAARGQYVAIWNVDDLRTPDSLAAQAAMLDNNPNAGVAYGDFITVPVFGGTTGITQTLPRLDADGYTRSMVFGPFMMWRRDMATRAGWFDEQFKSGADFDLSIRLALHADALKTDTLLGYYLNAGTGLSTAPNSKQVVERTVIELRYGIYDKIDYRRLPEALAYDIYNLTWDKQRFAVEQFVPNFKAWHAARVKDGQHQGLWQGALRTQPWLRWLKNKLPT